MLLCVRLTAGTLTGVYVGEVAGHDDFVSLDDGTGIVHIAPAYGDLEIGRKYGLPALFSVDLSGNIMPEFAELGFGGVFFKKADPLITRNLQERGLLFRSGRVHHQP